MLSKDVVIAVTEQFEEIYLNQSPSVLIRSEAFEAAISKINPAMDENDKVSTKLSSELFLCFKKTLVDGLEISMDPVEVLMTAEEALEIFISDLKKSYSGSSPADDWLSECVEWVQSLGCLTENGPGDLSDWFWSSYFDYLEVIKAIERTE